MPPSLSDAPEEIQVAFFIYERLPDKYDAMSGVYFGKDLSILETLYSIYEVEDRKTVTDFILKIQHSQTKSINADLERKRKAQQKKHGR